MMALSPALGPARLFRTRKNGSPFVRIMDKIIHFQSDTWGTADHGCVSEYSAISAPAGIVDYQNTTTIRHTRYIYK